MSGFWAWFVGILTAGSMAGCIWLCVVNSRIDNPEKTTGHVWDENLEEYNNPLPLWWLLLFYGSVIFAIAYLVLFPGFGNFGGALGWSSQDQHAQELQAAENRYGDVYAPYVDQPLAQLVNDPRAVELGRRLYAANCTTCHGSDGRGARGFPNLTDDDWLYGGTPDAVKTTILHGRNGVMPALGAVVGEQGIVELVEHLKTLRGASADAALAQAGATRFATVCAACHGADGRGNQILGAPNLTDDTWLYSSADEVIADTIRGGRANRMPAQVGLLGEERIHLLAAYVLSLSAATGGASASATR